MGELSAPSSPAFNVLSCREARILLEVRQNSQALIQRLDLSSHDVRKRNPSKKKKERKKKCDPIMLRRLIVRIRITQEGDGCWSASPPALRLAGNVAAAATADEPASGELPSFFRGGGALGLRLC